MIRDIRGVTETQIGTIAENLVATGLILESNGRLSPFKPIADDSGVDLLVYDKNTGYAFPLQVKSRTKTLKTHPKITHFEVRQATFGPNQDGFVLAVLFGIDSEELGVRRAWLIPMRELEDVSRKSASKLVIRPSHDPTSRDRYSRFRCEDLAEVTRRLVDKCDRFKRRGAD